ncbi:hypothetical protein AOLI_G00119270 [Acnodon oligacanthus]
MVIWTDRSERSLKGPRGGPYPNSAPSRGEKEQDSVTCDLIRSELSDREHKGEGAAEEEKLKNLDLVVIVKTDLLAQESLRVRKCLGLLNHAMIKRACILPYALVSVVSSPITVCKVSTRAIITTKTRGEQRCSAPSTYTKDSGFLWAATKVLAAPIIGL